MDNLDNIKALVVSVLDELDIELVDINLQGGNRKKVLRVYVHEEGGVTLDRCAKASRMISDLFDRKDIITSKYTLEVSSPGLDRPLKFARDFERNVGEKVKVSVFIEDKEREIAGIIKEVTGETIYLQTKDNKIIHFEILNVKSAKIIVEF